MKKVLFININFRYDNSSGITVSKLVDHLPKENLFLLGSKAEQSNIDIFSRKYQIGKLQETAITKKVGKRYSVKKVLRNIIGKKSYFNKLSLDVSIKRWLDTINPDFIYFNPDNLSTVLFAQEVASYCNAKIIIHVMDDKVSVRYPGIFGFFYKIKFRKEFSHVVKISSIRLSISELMTEEYLERYGVSFYAFHNPVDITLWKSYKKVINNYKKNNINIYYSGWIGSTSAPIFEFCEVIKNLNDIKYNITFVLYSKFSSLEIKDKIDAYCFTQINNYVPQEKLPETMNRADLLLLPLSFEKKNKFIFLSMPTKTAEYMVSGVPIIVYAPKETALSQYAKKDDWGHVITSNIKKDVVNSMRELIGNVELQKKYSHNALKLAKEKHDIKINKQRFDELLNEENYVQK